VPHIKQNWKDFCEFAQWAFIESVELKAGGKETDRVFELCQHAQ